MKKIIIMCIVLIIGCVYYSKSNETINYINTIFIDPGHGGMDGGAIGEDGTEEKTINLKICLKLKDKLESNGYVVLMTREGDYDLASDNSKNRKSEDINKRINMINESMCDIYISIHANIYLGQSSGAQVFYNGRSDQSKSLAEVIQESIRNNLNNTNRKASKIKDILLVDEVEKVGCLIEVGFMSDHTELLLLKSNEYQDKMAEAIYNGIMNYKINN